MLLMREISDAPRPRLVRQASRKVHLILSLLSGGLFLAMAGAIELTQSRSLHLSPVQIGLVVVGLAFVLIGLFPPPLPVRAISQGLSLSFVSFVAFLLFLEAVCRLTGFDFVGEERAYRRLPIPFRWPIVPTGEVYFRREGPEEWTGRPLRQICQQLEIVPNPYEGEPEVTIRFNEKGFRHEDALTDWEIAVAGDSFTEESSLPYDQLFTTIMSRTMNTRVLNLGNTATGPLGQLSFLRDYGLASSTRRTVVVFFEGNDLSDLDREYNDLMQYRATGQRSYRTFARDTSLVRALYKMATGQRTLHPAQRMRQLLGGSQPQSHSWITGFFKTPDGEIPITLGSATVPPSRRDLSPAMMKQLTYFFEQYGAFGQEHNIETWLAYMPTKERATYGMVRLADTAPADVKQWRPTDLPEVISELCAGHGVRFMDLTPAFVRAAETTHKLSFNGIYDGHLNAEGSRVVAAEMARVLSAAD